MKNKLKLIIVIAIAVGIGAAATYFIRQQELKNSKAIKVSGNI